MTIQAETHHTKKHKHSSRKHNKKKDSVSVTVNEKSPLIPKKKTGGHNEFNGASMSGAVMNLSTTIIGAGIMALPATMKVLGLGLGIVVIVIVAVLSEATVKTMLKHSKAGGADSYGGLMGDVFGDLGKKMLEACVVINNLGVLVIYMIILGDVVAGSSSEGLHHPGLLEGWFGQHWWTGRVFVLLVTTLGVFVPLASLKRMDSLSVTSGLAVALAVVFLIVLAGIAIVKMASGSLPMPRFLPDVTDLNSVWNLFTAVPVLVTAYICHFNVHPIRNELEDPSLIEPIVQISLVLCTTVYIMTSFFGFILFGDSTMGDILSNFDSDLGVPFSYLLNDIVRVSYALHLMLVFPLVFYALRLNTDGLFFSSSELPLEFDNKRFIAISVGLLSLIYLGANFIPSAWDAFQFTGATAAVCIGFIFPASVAIRDVYGISTKGDKILAVLMICLAVFANVVAIYSDAYALFKRNPSPRA
ncbi:putative amino acid transporter, transmembrane domain-containing protein [Helianthus annuus]|nr:putative amino acid transporter, transmembrane domain-containing protein [Helianthus annuus]KAJ0504859.1 putative amino acid transporter, transmembrane domain-containing protein [Helianthus annuus]KAJ0862262.1 putative amino acid transporter, transmembrane domain-containing protein [Helianthus annuus]